MLKLDMKAVAESGQHSPERIANLQVAVYVMCGGGMLGLMAAEQPADFYIDDRCGRLPYSEAEICQAIEVLKTLAAKAGLNPHKMPTKGAFHACGIW